MFVTPAGVNGDGNALFKLRNVLSEELFSAPSQKVKTKDEQEAEEAEAQAKVLVDGGWQQLALAACVCGDTRAFRLTTSSCCVALRCRSQASGSLSPSERRQQERIAARLAKAASGPCRIVVSGFTTEFVVVVVLS